MQTGVGSPPPCRSAYKMGRAPDLQAVGDLNCSFWGEVSLALFAITCLERRALFLLLPAPNYLLVTELLTPPLPPPCIFPAGWAVRRPLTFIHRS